MDLHRIPGVRNFPIAGQVVAGLLIKSIADVGVLSLAQPAPGHVARLVEVVPGEAAVGGFQALKGQRDGRPWSWIVAVLRHSYPLFQS